MSKWLVWIIVFACLAVSASAGIIVNETFEDNNVVGWSSEAGANITINSTNPLSGSYSGWAISNGGDVYSAYAYSGPQTANYTANLQVKIYQLGGGNDMYFSLSESATAPDNAITIRCDDGGNWEYYDGGAYQNIGLACADNTQYNFSILHHSFGADSKADFVINGLGYANNTESRGLVPSPTHIDFAGQNTNKAMLLDNICLCTGNWNTTCCDAGVPPPGGDHLNITGFNPPTNQQYNSNPVDFNVTVDSAYDFNCSLLLNGVVNQTQFGLVGAGVFVDFNESLSVGRWNYSFFCENNATNETSAERYLFFDDAVPVITTLVNPEGLVFFNENLSGRWNLTDNFYLHSLNVTIDGVQIDYLSEINATYYPYNLSYNVTNLTSGNHTLNLRLADGHTAAVLGGEYEVDTGWWDRYLKYEFWDDGSVEIRGLPDSIFDDFTTTRELDRYSFTYEPSDVRDNYSFEVKSEDKIFIVDRPESEYKSWLVMGEHWLDFVMPEEPNMVVEIERIDDFNVLVHVSNLENPELQLYSSIGDLNVVNVSFFFGVVDGNVTYLNPVLDANPQTINFTVNTTSSILNSTDALLFWNGTGQAVVKVSNPGVDMFYSTFLTPTIGSPEVNVTFRWAYNLTGVNGSEVGNLTFNQSIRRVTFTNCTGGNVSLRVSNWDEDVPNNNLNMTMEIEGLFWVNGSSAVKAYNFTFTGNHTYTLCLDPFGTTIFTDAYIKYTTLGGFTHRYYLVNQSLNNVTLNLSVYNFDNTSGVSDLKITVRNRDNYQYFVNVLARLQRHYVGEGVWRTVQMDETGDYGQLFFNVYEEDTDYRFIFFDRLNNILLTSQSMKFICTGGVCEVTQLLDPWSPGDAADNLTFVWNFYNSTGLSVVNWSDPTGVNAEVNTRVWRETMESSLLLCNLTTTAASGSHVCNVTGLSGTFFSDSRWSRSPWTYESSNWFNYAPGILGEFISTSEGALWTVGFILTVVMTGVFSPVGCVIALVFGLVFSFFLGFLSVLSVTLVILAAIIAMLIGVKVRT